MMESILGMLIGGGILIGGFHHHDINFDPRNPHRPTLTSLDYRGSQYDFVFEGDTRPKQNRAYLAGTVGAAIFAFSAKYAWDHIRKKQEKAKHGRGIQWLGMLAGGGFAFIGTYLHDHGIRRDGRRVTYNSIWQPILVDPPSDFPEHMGFLAGATGGAIFALSIKHAWEERKKPDPVSVNLDQAYQRFHIRLKQDQIARGDRRRAAAFRLHPLTKAEKIAPFPSRLVSDGRYLDQTRPSRDRPL